MCCEVSEAFVYYLHLCGHTTAVTLDMSAVGHPSIPDGYAHTVVEVDGIILDLTHRQFGQDLAHPHVEPAEHFLTHWRIHGRA